MRSGALGTAAVLAALAWGGPGLPAAAAAQAPLDAVDSLAAAGRTSEARERLTAWWESSGAGASRPEMQRALWLRGTLSADADAAERAYQRLVVEFPGGSHGARALLRLGQLSHARGDLPGAAERFRAVVRDYAETPERLEALRWLERHGARAEELAASPATREASPPPREAAPREAAPDAGGPPGEPLPAPPVERGDYAVQLGAFSREGGARTLAGRAGERGFSARLVRVPGSELIRVRVGRFASADEARSVEARLRRLGFETAVVSDARAETPVR